LMPHEAPPSTARHRDFVRAVADGKKNDRLQAIYNSALHENARRSARSSVDEINEESIEKREDRHSRRKQKGKSKRPVPGEEDVMPFAAARAMLQQRLQAVVMQDKNHMRNLWNQLEPDGKGYLNGIEFHNALRTLGIDLSEQDAIQMMAKFSDHGDRLHYEDFVLNFLTLPKDFFSANFMKTQAQVDSAAPENTQELNAKAQLQDLFPRVTSVNVIDKAFRTRIRKRLLDVHRCMFLILKRPNPTAQYLGKGELYTIFDNLGVMLKNREIDEIMKYFDHNDDGKIHYEEMACELLMLPRPHALHGTTHKNNGQNQRASRQRQQLASRTSELLNMLRLNCERASVTPKTLLEMFKHFDADGSGMVAYDEIKDMVREYGCNVEGADAASMLLEKYVGPNSGVMSYVQFITKVLGLLPDSLRGENKHRMSTPELQQAGASSFKRQMNKNPVGLKKVFDRFDRDGSGQLSYKEFCEGVAFLGLPLDPVNMKKIFNAIDTDGSGHITTEELAEQILQVPGMTARSNSSSHAPEGSTHMSRVPSSKASARDGDHPDYVAGVPTKYHAPKEATHKSAARHTSRRGTARPNPDMNIRGEATTSQLMSTLASSYFEQDPFEDGSYDNDNEVGAINAWRQEHGSTAATLEGQRSRSPTKLIPLQSYRSHSVPPSLPSSYRSRAPSRNPILDELIASHSTLPLPMSRAASGAGRHSLPPTQRSMHTRRSMPKTVLERQVSARISHHRHTFGKESSTPRMPAWLPKLPTHPSPLMRVSTVDRPDPCFKVHGIDGRQSVGMKPVGGGGLTQDKQKEWIGGADRTCNVHLGQPQVVATMGGP